MFLIAMLPVTPNLLLMRMSSRLTASRQRPSCRLEQNIHPDLRNTQPEGQGPKSEKETKPQGGAALTIHKIAGRSHPALGSISIARTRLQRNEAGVVAKRLLRIKRFVEDPNFRITT